MKDTEIIPPLTDTADTGSNGKGRRRGTVFLTMLFFVSLFMLLPHAPGEATVRAAGKTSEKVPEISSVSELDGKKVGVFTGTIFDQLTEQYIKDPQIVYFDSGADSIKALEIGKIDGFLLDDAMAKALRASWSGMRSYRFLISTAAGNARSERSACSISRHAHV